jgi:hypothetical protein
MPCSKSLPPLAGHGPAHCARRKSAPKLTTGSRRNRVRAERSLRRLGALVRPISTGNRNVAGPARPGTCPTRAAAGRTKRRVEEEWRQAPGVTITKRELIKREAKGQSDTAKQMDAAIAQQAKAQPPDLELKAVKAEPAEPGEASFKNPDAQPPAESKAETQPAAAGLDAPEPERKKRAQACKVPASVVAVAQEADAAAERAQREEPEQTRPSVELAVKKGALALSPIIAAGVALNAASAEMLDALNERHAVIGNVGGKCRVVEWVPSELDPGALVAVFQPKTDFINRYANRQVGWKRRGEPLTAGEWWFDHPDRADYRGVMFRPGAPAVISRRDHGNWLNLWRGWGVMPQKGRWPLMRDHVEQILSGGDPKAADYNIRWTAWGFQHPGEPAEAANVYRGRKGGGKSLWCGTKRRIYGPHGLQITHASHLTGNFNAHLATCCYLFADEAFWAGDKQGEAVLKGLITERPAMITRKGVDSVGGVNCVKLEISSNSDWVVPASHDERRFAVNDIDPRYSRGVAPEEVRKEYFGALAVELREGGAEAMLYDLLQMDLGDWHPREVPVTAGLMRQKKASLRGNFQWLEPLLQSGQLPATAGGRPNRIATHALIAYAQTFRGLEYATDESIASFLYDEMGLSSQLSPEGNRYRGSKGGARGWEFPPLLDLRTRWETKFGGEWPWHSPEVTEWEKG